MPSSVDYAVDALDRDLALEVLESGSDCANVPIRLLDLDPFVRTCVEVYDKVNDRDRAVLPLTRIWMPAQRTGQGNISFPCPVLY